MNATLPLAVRRDALPFCGSCGTRLPALTAEAVACPYCGDDLAMRRATSASARPWVAAALSLAVPGAGQVLNGHFFRGLFILATCWLVIPWMFGVLDAYVQARRAERQGGLA